MTLVSERIGQFFHDDHRLEYTEYGSGHDWVVLVPGQLMPRRMHQPLARKIAAAGGHVVTLDLLGHGRSDRPADPLLYSTTAFGDQVIALLDHLDAHRAVLGGSALGANVALEAALAAPGRVSGLLLEMPVLDNALGARMITSAPLLVAARFAPLAVRGVRMLSRAVPRPVMPFWVGIGLDSLDQQPAAMAATVHGIFFGPLGPPASRRARIDVPALVVGHPYDPLHPVADAEMLAEELTSSTYIAAGTVLEWRLRPDRLDRAALAFVAECFRHPDAGRLLGASS